MGKYVFAALFFEKIKQLWYNILKNDQRRQIMNQPTLADEEIIVHLIKDFIEGEGSFKKSDKKYKYIHHL